MRSHRFTKPYNLKNYKFGIVTLVGILSVLGILVVGSAKESLQSKQILGVIIGFTAMIVVSLHVDYEFLLGFVCIVYHYACSCKIIRRKCKWGNPLD